MFTLSSNATSNVKSYPSTSLNKASNFITMFDTTILPYNMKYNGCKSTFCYNNSKGTFIYKPHSAVGMVGTSASSYLHRRKRI
jgi:hypothetical protein